jgi:Metal-dependent hydrolases of the beta-lactamase superfamily I
MVKFLSLSSGSNGNCYYIGNEETSLLIDLGVGLRTLKKRLALCDIDISRIDSVLVSHDHVDHIRSLGGFTDKYKKPVYATEKLHKALNHHFCTEGHLAGCVKILTAGEENTLLSGVKVIPFSVPHDASDTVGYHIDFFGEKFTFMTDIGAPTDDAVRFASLASHLIVESNYDFDSLIRGTYPKELKMRIMQGHGHLSNEQTASLLKRSWHEGLKDIYLCHLSENNNTPKLAFDCASEALQSIGVCVGRDVTLHCLPRREPSPVFTY